MCRKQYKINFEWSKACLKSVFLFSRMEVSGPYSYCFLSAASRIYSQNSTEHFCGVLSSLFANCFVRVQVVQLYNSTDMALAWRNSYSIYQRSDFHTVDNLSIAIHALIHSQ